VHLVKSILDLYNEADLWEEILDLTRRARQKGWWQAYGITDNGFIGLETEACLVRDFEATYVPGLLQTEDYARAVFRAEGVFKTDEAIMQHVAARMIRQKRLVDNDGLELQAVVDEAVLRRPVGGLDAMRAQLRQMADRAALPNVRLHVLSTAVGAHVGMGGMFIILSFPNRAIPDTLYIEHVTGSVQSEIQDEIYRCSLKFDRLCADALDQDASIEFIRGVAAEL
jgi:hypothetical protein